MPRQDHQQRASPAPGHPQPDELLSIVSHDLKEPLRGISTYCKALLEDYGPRLDQEVQRRLRVVEASCRRLATLIDSLLSYCGVDELAASGVCADLNAGVEHVLETLGPMIHERRASVRVEGRLPQASIHPALLAAVLSNLICNGLKFNESPHPCVEIGPVEQRPPTIYVRDNGIGIPREHHEAIFAPFWRLHSRKRYEGSGLGLAIVRKIVAACGGRIWVQSAPGQGSTFFVALRPDPGTSQPASRTGPPHWGPGACQRLAAS
ncbi:MAG: sensor histidine kinase [Thermoguttaceae bacterium]